MTPFDFKKWQPQTSHLAEQFIRAQPFPHLCLDNFLNTHFADQVLLEFPNPDEPFWTKYRHLSSNKLGLSDRQAFPTTIGQVVDELQSERFVRWLSELTHIPNLIPDPTLEGGGMHLIEPGGYLNIHSDFSNHYRQPLWRRRINLLIYFNRAWNPDWNGSLELWDKNLTHKQKEIAPIFNRSVIFTTDLDSFHGHPAKLMSPKGIYRKSLAFYYFTADARSSSKSRATFFVARPEDSFTLKFFIFIDRQLIRFYSFLRAKVGFSDRIISNALKYLFRSKK